MRIWQIAFFIFVFQLMVNVGTTIPLGFESSSKVEPIFNDAKLNETTQKISGTMNNTDAGVFKAAADFTQSIMFIISGVGTLAGIFIGAVLHTGTFINTIFGGTLPPSIAGELGLIPMIIRLVYIIGVMQLFLGRSIKGDA